MKLYNRKETFSRKFSTSFLYSEMWEVNQFQTKNYCEEKKYFVISVGPNLWTPAEEDVPYGAAHKAHLPASLAQCRKHPLHALGGRSVTNSALG